MRRTHRMRHDREWLPRDVRGARWAVTGSVWGAAGATIGAVLLVGGPAAFVLWKALVVAGAVAAGAGERAGNAIMRRQLGKLTRGEVELADLSARADGELVVVRGIVAADTLLPGILVDTTGVYRRLVFRVRGKWVHEEAVDFRLVDGKGENIIIQAAGARWLTPSRELIPYPVSRFTGERVPREVAARAGTRDEVDAYEKVLTAGTEIQVVGYKTATGDVSGAVVDYRLPPQRATLRSSADLPLVICAVEDL